MHIFYVDLLRLKTFIPLVKRDWAGSRDEIFRIVLSERSGSQVESSVLAIEQPVVLIEVLDSDCHLRCRDSLHCIQSRKVSRPLGELLQRLIV